MGRIRTNGPGRKRVLADGQGARKAKKDHTRAGSTKHRRAFRDVSGRSQR